ncbi:MAG: phosphonoacetaldehyde hydrolase [Alphaproteobacteria bacterium]|nr:phosphonoacetaldehyde hydrolase [Alphaproteobacteria bacterium]
MISAPTRHRYRGRLKAVIFDWAGTLVDFGSLAPMGVFVEVFSRFGLEISVAEARAFMGLAKREHIAALLNLPRVADEFRSAYRRAPGEADIDAIYQVFVPANVAAIPRHCDAVPGAAETIASLRARGLGIGSTTGYTREIMAVLAPLAAKQGVRVDAMVCAGDVPWGRPTPAMMYKCFLDLGVWPAAACVKVDDTPAGIGEGVAAGAWTVGVCVSGNAFGRSLAETTSMSPAEFAESRAAAAASLAGAGAHIVIDTVADLLPALARVEARLATGAAPDDGPCGD